MSPNRLKELVFLRPRTRHGAAAHFEIVRHPRHDASATDREGSVRPCITEL